MRLFEAIDPGFNPKEQWRPIVGWQGYEVSNLGRVRNASGRVLKPQIHYGRSKEVPYLRVQLTQPGMRKNRRINRLVAQAFVPNPNKYPEVDHIDGNTLNNKAINLEWVTPEENIRRKNERAVELQNRSNDRLNKLQKRTQRKVA